LNTASIHAGSAHVKKMVKLHGEFKNMVDRSFNENAIEGQLAGSQISAALKSMNAQLSRSEKRTLEHLYIILYSNH